MVMTYLEWKTIQEKDANLLNKIIIGRGPTGLDPFPNLLHLNDGKGMNMFLTTVLSILDQDPILIIMKAETFQHPMLCLIILSLLGLRATMAAVRTDVDQGPEAGVHINITVLSDLDSNHNPYQMSQEAGIEIKVISKDYHPH